MTIWAKFNLVQTTNHQYDRNLRKLGLAIILVTVILTVSSLSKISSLEVDYSIESLIPKNNKDKKFYDEVVRDFSLNPNNLFITLKSESGIFNQKFLGQFDSLSNELSKIELIENLISINTIRDYIKTPLGTSPIRFLHPYQPERYINDSLRIFSDPRITNSLFSERGNSTLIILTIARDMNLAQKEDLIDNIESVVSEYLFDGVYYFGDISTEVRYIESINSELKKWSALTISFAVIIAFLLFRSFPIILILLASLLASFVFSFAFLGTFFSLSLLSAVLPTIIMIVGVSDAIHIYNKFHNELIRTKNKSESITQTIREVGRTTFLTSLTTSIGFLALYVSNIIPIQEFGVSTAIIVLLTYLVTITFTSSCLFIFHPSKPIKGLHELLTKRIIDKIQLLIISNFKKTIPFIIIIILIGTFSLFKLDTNNHLLDNISNRNPIKTDLSFIEENFHGVRSMEFIFLPRNKHINNLDVLQEIEKFQNHLASYADITVVASPVTVYKSLNKIYNNGSWSNYILPTRDKEITKYSEAFYRGKRDLSLLNVITNDFSKGRLVARVKDKGSVENIRLAQEIEKWAKENLRADLIQAKSTGQFLIRDKIDLALINDMVKSLMLAMLIISIIMGILFKDLYMIFIAFITNIIPLLISVIFIVMVGINLNGSMAMIFSIGFAIAVDDTIHYLARYKLELKNQGPESAIMASLKETGTPIIITSIILFAGYSLLMFSEFKEFVYQGILMCLIILSALLSDLFILPSLLLLRYKNSIVKNKFKTERDSKTRKIS